MKKRVGKIIVGMFTMPFILIVMYFAYCEINKAYWDRQVRLMCEKNGGVKVFEEVILTKKEYLKNDGHGSVIQVWSEKISKNYHEYAYRSKRSEIRISNPEVWKTEYITYRKSDNKILGIWVTYARRGGDAFVVDAGTSFSCADVNIEPFEMEKRIFTIIGE